MFLDPVGGVGLCFNVLVWTMARWHWIILGRRRLSRMPVNQWSPDSNCCGNNAFAPVLMLLMTFSFSTKPRFNHLYKLLPGFRLWWKYVWVVEICMNSCLMRNCNVAECFPEKSSWYRKEQGVKCYVLWAAWRTGYRAPFFYNDSAFTDLGTIV